MFFTIVVGLICLLVGILLGCLIERHFAAQAEEEEMPRTSSAKFEP